MINIIKERNNIIIINERMNIPMDLKRLIIEYLKMDIADIPYFLSCEILCTTSAIEKIIIIDTVEYLNSVVYVLLFLIAK